MCLKNTVYCVNAVWNKSNSTVTVWPLVYLVGMTWDCWGADNCCSEIWFTVGDIICKNTASLIEYYTPAQRINTRNDHQRLWMAYKAQEHPKDSRLSALHICIFAFGHFQNFMTCMWHMYILHFYLLKNCTAHRHTGPRYTFGTIHLF